MGHSVEELQEGMGQTGHFGEAFVGLAFLIFSLGVVLLGLGLTGFFGGSPAGANAAGGDALVTGILFVVEGVGFGLFGVLAILMGWGRHHPAFEF